MATPEENLYEVEEMLNQPGTYFNPQSEVVVIVDDSASLDQEVFDNLEGYEGAEWVRISDDVPVDEDGRDRALESFGTQSQAKGLAPEALEGSEDDFEEEEERPEDRSVPEGEED
ncbi:MAG TPA: hypothetical protein VN732_08695 [Solirubrobacterales bacterium]|nr:hypothetical protein [Solirubrobacterales bacterium]